MNLNHDTRILFFQIDWLILLRGFLNKMSLILLQYFKIIFIDKIPSIDVFTLNNIILFSLLIPNVNIIFDKILIFRRGTFGFFVTKVKSNIQWTIIFLCSGFYARIFWYVAILIIEGSFS